MRICMCVIFAGVSSIYLTCYPASAESILRYDLSKNSRAVTESVEDAFFDKPVKNNQSIKLNCIHNIEDVNIHIILRRYLYGFNYFNINNSVTNTSEEIGRLSPDEKIETISLVIKLYTIQIFYSKIK